MHSLLPDPGSRQGMHLHTEHQNEAEYVHTPLPQIDGLGRCQPHIIPEVRDGADPALSFKRKEPEVESSEGTC